MRMVIYAEIMYFCVKSRSDYAIATAIPHIATSGLYRTQWNCLHYATTTASRPIVSKNKSQSQILQCEQALKRAIRGRLICRQSRW